MAVGDVTSNEVGSGARFNDGKVRYDLIPTHLLESTANVLEYGARKYAPWNWAKGMQFSVVIGCIKRHMAAIERGEDIDPETGQRHTGHLMCNLLFLEHYMNMYPEMDDRPKEWFNKKEQNDEYPTAEQPDTSKQSSTKYPDPMVERGIPDLFPHVRAPVGEYIIYPAPWRNSDGAVAGHDCTDTYCV